MKLDTVVAGVWRVRLGMVNAFLVEDGDGLVLIDTGTPGSENDILAAVAQLSKQPSDVRHILVTHLHPDHTGSLAALKEATGAPVSMHPADAEPVANGTAMRPVEPAPGPVYWVVVKVLMRGRGPATVDPATTENHIEEGDVVDAAGGLRVIHAPGHSAGQVCFLWEQHGGVLFAADAATNMMGLGYPPLFEDLKQGIDTVKKLGGYSFEVACFGHGKPIMEGASRRFNERWGE